MPKSMLACVFVRVRVCAVGELARFHWYDVSNVLRIRHALECDAHHLLAHQHRPCRRSGVPVSPPTAGRADESGPAALLRSCVRVRARVCVCVRARVCVCARAYVCVRARVRPRLNEVRIRHGSTRACA